VGTWVLIEFDDLEWANAFESSGSRLTVGHLLRSMAAFAVLCLFVSKFHYWHKTGDKSATEGET